ncbi:MAG: long-chain fatty acid--CoA ligase [Rhodospirillales bacterium]|nr:long-chain fatty acid--CoA ligase [Rhodospirillales bacterium]
MFFVQADRFGERPLLWAKRDGRYRPLSWRDVAARVCGLARGLRAIGVERGDRVIVVAENRPEWLIADLAIMAAGAITVPAYTTNTCDDYRHILENSGAKGVIVSTSRLAQTLLEAANRLASVSFVIVMEPPSLRQHLSVDVLAWDAVVARGECDHSNVLSDAEKIASTDVACIIYTSGTGGAPKGVMLQHQAILHNCAGAIEIIQDIGPGNDVFLSFLPLSHAFEHTVGQFVPIALGAEIYYGESIDKVAANMLEARPTIIAAVPRFYEILQSRIMLAVRKQGGLRQRLFDRALAIGKRRLEQPQSLTLGDKLLDWALDRLVRRTVRARFGGRIRAMVSGGAPLNGEVASFFVALGLPLVQGYGQTEASPLISVNRPGRAKLHTVGPPLAGVDARIAEDGEILVRGKMIMKGYWHLEEATREVVRDGWLHTGDIGRIDEDGHICITDRKKDIIVNSGGDNLSPARIEGALTLRPEIAQAMVYGDRRPHLVALIVPEAGWAKQWAAQQGKPTDIAVLVDDDAFHQAIAEAIGDVNKCLSVIERVRRFALIQVAFGVDNGQLTPTLKLRRHVITTVYRDLLEELYARPSAPTASQATSQSR